MLPQTGNDNKLITTPVGVKGNFNLTYMCQFCLTEDVLYGDNDILKKDYPLLT